MENSNIGTSTGEDLEKAIHYVYASCDIDNNNQVPISKLLDFINNSSCSFELTELKKLDVDGDNLSVSCELFARIVMEWVRGRSLSLSNGFSNNKYYGCKETFSSIPQSYGESYLHCATISQERIKELEHKNKQLNSELDYVKAQLVGVEEQNDSLQSQNKKLSQKLLKIEKLNNELCSSKKNDCEFVEAVDQHEKEIYKLKKTLAFSEKTISSLKGDLREIEDEKKKLQDKLNLQKKYGEAKIELIKELELELQDKERKILSFVDSNSKLQTELSEQQQHLVHYSECDRIMKEQIKHLETVIQDHELRFSILKTTIISSPKPETPSRNVLTQILNFNSPKLLKNLANPISPNLDSPVTDFNFFHFSPDENHLNNSDLMCNNNESCLSVKICNNSLCDELLLADQDFHKYECQKIISQQKSHMEELDDVVKTYKNTEEKLKSEIENLGVTISDLDSSLEKLRHENQDLTNSLSETVKTTDVLHEEVVLLRECKYNRKLGNFSKMEIKLEKRDAEIEALRDMLRVEKNVSEKLKEEKLGLVNENVLLVKEKRLVQEQLQRTHNKVPSVLEDSSITVVDSELNQLALQIQDGLDGSDRSYCQVIEAVQKYEESIDSRFKHVHTCYAAHQLTHWEEFTKLEFMLRNLQLRLSDDPIIDFMHQLKILKQVSEDNQKMATAYGALCREHSNLKCIKLLITFTAQVREKAYDERSNNETMPSKRGNCCCNCVLFMFLLLLGLKMFLYLNGIVVSFYDGNPYLHAPPPT